MAEGILENPVVRYGAPLIALVGAAFAIDAMTSDAAAEILTAPDGSPARVELASNVGTNADNVFLVLTGATLVGGLVWAIGSALRGARAVGRGVSSTVGSIGKRGGGE